jgi:phosphoribosylaminoimidazolecarboxamide formyltransferase/IMP cyclohydrolase
MPNALISVYNKEGITEFASELHRLGWTLYASGGTAKEILNAKIPVKDVADLVGGGAILGHKVVTLSREIYAGLLATDSKEDRAELKRLNIPKIDLICVDLYPLTSEIRRKGSSEQSIIEQTDIGGPTLLRAAAKGRRIVVSQAEQRQKVINWIKDGMPDKEDHLKRLAAKAEATVARYALDSARYISDGRFDGAVDERVAAAAYGENPWQKQAWLYSHNPEDKLAITQFKLLQGNQPSYNNYCDLDRLLQTITHVAAGFDKNFGNVPFIALGAKHGNVCGAAFGKDKKEVIQKMVAGDPRAIFGGVVMLNFELDEILAEVLLTDGLETGRRLLDGVIAPAVTNNAIKMLRRKGDKCRLLTNAELNKLKVTSLDKALRTRYVRGGQLVQNNYTFVLDINDLSVERFITKPTVAAQSPEAKHVNYAREANILMAWAIGSTSTSNTITLVKDSQLIGNGVGQQDRVSACELAIKRAKDAGHDTTDSIAYSDSFFPFPDGVEVLARAGIKTIFASSGSVNDGKIVAACKSMETDLYMIPDNLGRGFYAH